MLWGIGRYLWFRVQAWVCGLRYRTVSVVWGTGAVSVFQGTGLCLWFEVIYLFFLVGFGILISSTQKLTQPICSYFDGSH